MPETPATRLASLDAFRGFTIAAMILVNNPGDWGHLYAPLAHAPWNGWTFTDTIFSSFLFICGVSMALSLARRAREGAERTALLLGLLRRAAIIFFVGLALNLVPEFNFATVRIPGVLQRIALCIAIAAPLVLWLDARGLWASIVALLVLYAAVMLRVPVPDARGIIGAGVLEPGRDVGAYLDRTLLAGHLWSKSKTWDPEGLLGTLPAACSLLLGVLAGRRMATPVRMALAGLAFLAAGLALDALLMPINKNLWSPSYVVFMNGWALLALAGFHFALDSAASKALRDRARQLALPFTIYGMNALAIFTFSGLVARLLAPYKATLYAPIAASGLAPQNASLAYAVLFNAAMLVVAWALWRKRWFIKA